MKLKSSPVMRRSLQWVAQGLSQFASQKRLAILIYHRVLAEPTGRGASIIDASTFRWQMDLIREHFNVLPFSEALELLQHNNLPPRAVAVTFDDGYADNATVALPILQELQIPATFFIATGFLNGGCMWNDQVSESIYHTDQTDISLTDLRLQNLSLHSMADRDQATQYLLKQLKYRSFEQRQQLVAEVVKRSGVVLPKDLMMTSSQVKQLHQAGMEVGAHTCNHPILQKVNKQQAEKEIADSKQQLEAIIGEPVTLFAYPNGRPKQDYGIEHVKMMRRLGFKAAVTTAWGVATAHSDIYQLPRFMPWDKQPDKFMARLVFQYRRTHPELAA
ncbi:polysaccharide deacetylase family protein [Spartinivicinus poritis]|uniref:Polysaccharide deacetylase family protein n=1 Tax=Spartinivicinus poritis TaxID=2994640 RepID=A0ABT5UE23_9GAMM|nr:polysaccharide deacetylase family protein [Spartinivicinus sp. A2-2]MDE1464616.1 polysaccharide deacetylase family protein [Spartinivicinus sp. A2-2]